MNNQFTQKQIDELKEDIKSVLLERVPVRFLKDGQALNILTGELSSKGSNVMYHPVYWDFTKEMSLKVAKWLDVKAVFSE